MSAAVHIVSDNKEQQKLKADYRRELETLRQSCPELAKVIKRRYSGRGWESSAAGLELIKKVRVFRQVPGFARETTHQFTSETAN